MIVIPAIDIQKGKVVRLFQGKFDKTTPYADNPAKIAQQWESLGAKLIHIVDLDGAQTEEIQNFKIIAEVAKAVNIPIQMGGGIRTQEDIERLLNHGVSRVVLGTKAIEDVCFLKKILSQWNKKIVVSLDCTNGLVAQRGWTEVSGLNGSDFAKKLAGLGLKTLVYTDISRDGALTGPNISQIKEILQAVNIDVIASGGVSSIEDIKNLKELEVLGLTGIIVGKALYEKRLDIKEALRLCSL